MIRRSKEHIMFRANDCTSTSAKERYQAFSNWVKEFHTSLQDWDVEAQVSTTVHQTLIGSSAESAPTILITTGQGSTGKTDKTQPSDPYKFKSCPYCKALHQNSDWSATETATQISAITKENFDATHRQFLNRGQKYVLPAGGCI